MLHTARSHTAEYPWRCYRVFTFLILLSAAAFKALNVSQVLLSGLLDSRWLLLLVIGIESAAAVYVLIGPGSKAWVVGVTIFALLATVAGYAALTGQNCGCFGSLIDAQIMFAADVAMVIGAVLLRPTARPRLEDPQQRGGGRFASIFATCAGISMILVAALADDNTDKANPLRFMLADRMVRRPWPLGATFHRDLAALESGRWIVLVLREDCDHCQSFVDNLSSAKRAERRSVRTVVFHAGRLDWYFDFDHVTLHAGRSASVRWKDREPFVATPAIFLVEDGVVTEAADNTQSADLLGAFRRWQK